MNDWLTISKNQAQASDRILRKLKRALDPAFLGLVAMSGHCINVAASPQDADRDAIASLAAGSFAATRQLAQLLDAAEFTVMSHEGKDLNVHIIQVSEDVLLVVCFRDSTDIGKVRLVSRKAAEALEPVMKGEGE